MTDVTSLVQEGLAHHQGGRLQQAAALYQRALQSAPRDAEANHLMGLLEHQAGRGDTAVRHLSEAVAAEPGNATYHSNLGVVLQSLRRLDEAKASYERAIALDPGIAAVHNNLGVVLNGLGRFEEARAAYQRALALEPRYAEAHANLGLTLQAMGRRAEAVAAYRQAIALRPRYAKAIGNLGKLLRELGKPEEAIANLRAALALRPLDAGLHNNLGLALRDADKLEEALASFQKAVALKPHFAKAMQNAGQLLADVGRQADAVTSFQAALAVQEDASTYFALGMALSEIDRIEEAAAAFLRAAEIEPGDGRARSKYWRMRSEGCDWADFDALRDQVRQAITASSRARTTEPVTPFRALCLLDEPERHLLAAAHRAEALLERTRPIPAATVPHAPAGARSADDRIRIAYLSSDFRSHPVAFQIVELLEMHDRSRFDVHGFSHGPSVDSSAIRERIRDALTFHDLGGASARDIAAAVAELDVDIAIDLNGYTQHSKSHLLAYRPAPIQVQYLGYPGTLGADFADYVIADPIVIPEVEQQHYAERIAYLPHSYMVNDRQRPLPAARLERSACGLPEDGFVFACFNAHYKITPDIFAIWVRLLRQVDGSVLWLPEGSSWAKQNLRAELEKGGVAPERLILAPRLPQIEDHLARIANADLFLDTLPYNAHSTATDALWMGLPVVTTPGRSFASRVGASLLHAAGLPELVAPSLEAYEELALELARAPERLAALRRRLIDSRQTAPLFDTPAFTRHIEAAYARMWQLHREGKAPETFRIDAIG